MKAPVMIACATTLLVTLVVAQKPNISLVKGAPTNYGAYGFDISWVEPSTEKYYVTDRTNNAIDFVDAATDTFIGFIGKGNYTGTRPCPGHPKHLRHCAGPNGVVTDDLGHVWAGDGAGDLIEADASKPGTEPRPAFLCPTWASFSSAWSNRVRTTPKSASTRRTETLDLGIG